MPFIQYQRLRFCIFILLLFACSVLAQPIHRQEIRILLLDAFQPRLEKNVYLNYELLKQTNELHSYFKEILRNQKNYTVKLDSVSKLQKSFSDNALLSLEEELKSDLNQTLLVQNPMALIKGTYIIVDDIFIIAIRVFDVKTGAICSFAFSENADNNKLNQDICRKIKYKLAKVSSDIIAFITTINGMEFNG